MISKNLRSVKRTQKETQLLREISNLILQLSLDEPAVRGLYVNRVNLSQDKSVCHIYFSDSDGEEKFREKVGHLILYKPSLRSALAKSLDQRYTPDLFFHYDKVSEKQKRIDELFNKIATENK